LATKLLLFFTSTNFFLKLFSNHLTTAGFLYNMLPLKRRDIISKASGDISKSGM